MTEIPLSEPLLNQDSDNNSDISKKMLPLLPLKDIVVFPHMIVPVFIGEDICINAVDVALGGSSKQIFLSAFTSNKTTCSEHPNNHHHSQNSEESSKFDPPFDVYQIGTVCSIMRTRKLPDGRMKVLVQGLYRASLVEIVSKKHYPLVCCEKIIFSDPNSTELSNIEAMIRVVRDNLEKIVNLGKMLSPDILLIVEDVKDPSRLCDLIASNLGLKVADAQEILRSPSAYDSLSQVNSYLCKEIEVYQMQQRIQSQAKEEINKMQREHYLREQIRVLKNELGDHDHKSEIEGFWQTLKDLNLPEEANNEIKKHLQRLQRVHQDTSEAVLSRTYVETMLGLPWNKESVDNLELKNVSRVLDEDHYGLDTVKERILEYLAVKKLNPKLNPPILCFVGPPGVGKTSLGRSIARAMNRKFSRISLGGVRDDAEIRGHRKTYVGAYPGRVISSIQKSNVLNPLIMFDELDKISQDHRGDPASALLEVLDPSQNHTFHDHYLGVPFDISKVLFIANANSLETIPHALKDRLEIIQVSGYTYEEKIWIAQDFLIPKQICENGLKDKNLLFTKSAIELLINQYTKESGLRGLEKKIGCICRKQARIIAEQQEKPTSYKSSTDHPTLKPEKQDKDKQDKENKTSQSKTKSNDKIDTPIKITSNHVEKLLGAPSHGDNFFHLEPEIGVALGMAYTNCGGDIIAIEVNSIHSPSTNMILTGQLGDVMKESASASLSYLKSCQSEYKIPKGALDCREFHIHVPQGAVAKDGPSAGIAITSALLSAFLNKPPRTKTCLTGEMTLHGKILPVGGLKEKILAAQREGLDLAIIPEKNRCDYLHLPISTKRKIKVIFVSSYKEVYHILFSNTKGVKIDNNVMTFNTKRSSSHKVAG